MRLLTKPRSIEYFGAIYLGQQLIELLHEFCCAFQQIKLVNCHWVRIKVHDVIAYHAHLFELRRYRSLIDAEREF